MSNIVGLKALRGEWEKIVVNCFEIEEDMIMGFEGRSCKIMDQERNIIPDGKLGSNHGRVEREVLAGYRCLIMRALVRFEKKASQD